jgi:hypothetical protein
MQKSIITDQLWTSMSWSYETNGSDTLFLSYQVNSFPIVEIILITSNSKDKKAF